MIAFGVSRALSDGASATRWGSEDLADPEGELPGHQGPQRLEHVDVILHVGVLAPALLGHLAHVPGVVHPHHVPVRAVADLDGHQLDVVVSASVPEAGALPELDVFDL